MAFTTSTVGGRLRVVPLDARPLLRAGRLDPELFDLTALTRFGYDDRRADLPLLVMSVTGQGAWACRRALHTAFSASVVRIVDGSAFTAFSARGAGFGGYCPGSPPSASGAGAGRRGSLR